MAPQRRRVLAPRRLGSQTNHSRSVFPECDPRLHCYRTPEGMPNEDEPPGMLPSRQISSRSRVQQAALDDPRPPVVNPDYRDPLISQILAQPQIKRPSRPQQPPNGPAQCDHNVRGIPRPMPQQRQQPVRAVHLQVPEPRPRVRLHNPHHIQ